MTKINLNKSVVTVASVEEAHELFLAQAKAIAKTEGVKAMKADGFEFSMNFREWAKAGEGSGVFYANIIVSKDGQRFAKRFQQAPLGNYNSKDNSIFQNFDYKTISVIYSLVKINFGKVAAAKYFPELAGYRKASYTENCVAI